MTKKEIIEKMKSKKGRQYNSDSDKNMEDGDSEGMEDTSGQESSELEDIDVETMENPALMIGDKKLRGQALVDFVIKHQEAILEKASNSEDEQKSIIDEMDY